MLRAQKFILTIFILSLIINLGFLYYFVKNDKTVQVADKASADQSRYPLLSKRIHYELPQDLLMNFLVLRSELREQVGSYGNAFGFYFEYLPTGTSIGVNEKTQFYAASLFKVPVVMTYYHFRERTKMQDDPILEIKPEYIDNNFGNLWQKGAGAKIKASEAVRLAIVESDNTAVKILAPYLKQQDFDAVYKALDIDFQSDDKGTLISAKNYSSILKSLYFSSVLNKNDSHEILDLLTRTKFSDKLVAGIPSDIRAAHKIGDFVDEKGVYGYRDCGIIYVPRRPYILCMFSVGDEQIAQTRMQLLSKTVYEYITKAL